MRDAKRDVRAERERDAITTQEERVRGPAGGHDAYLREAGGCRRESDPADCCAASGPLSRPPRHADPSCFSGSPRIIRSEQAAERASERASERERGTGWALLRVVCGDRHCVCVGKRKNLGARAKNVERQPSPARVEETTGGSQRAARLAALNISPARATHARPRWWSGGSHHAAARTQLADDLHAAGDRDHTRRCGTPQPFTHTRQRAHLVAGSQLRLTSFNDEAIDREVRHTHGDYRWLCSHQNRADEAFQLLCSEREPRTKFKPPSEEQKQRQPARALAAEEKITAAARSRAEAARRGNALAAKRAISPGSRLARGDALGAR